MKGWAKKMIWFFGLQLFYLLQGIANYLIGQPEPEMTLTRAIVGLGIYFIPMFYLGDDKETKCDTAKKK